MKDVYKIDKMVSHSFFSKSWKLYCVSLQWQYFMLCMALQVKGDHTEKNTWVWLLSWIGNRNLLKFVWLLGI